MKRKYFIIGFVSGIIFFIIALVLVFYLVKNNGEKSIKKHIANSNVNKVEIEAYPITQEALDSLFFYKLHSDTTYSITKDNKPYTFISFWATWCSPCIYELPLFEKLIKTNQNKFIDIKFIFASMEKDEKIETFKKEKEILLPYYLYHVNELPAFINHSTIPTSYFINEKKKIMYKFSGLRKWDTNFYQKLLLNLE